MIKDPLTPAQLVAWREARDWDRKALADHLGISEQSVADMETGAAPIPVMVALALDGLEMLFSQRG